MLSESCTGFPAFAVDEVDHTRWEPSLLDKGSEVENGEGCLLSGLQNDCVTSAERGSEFPSSHRQREIPSVEGVSTTFLKGRIKPTE